MPRFNKPLLAVFVAIGVLFGIAVVTQTNLLAQGRMVTTTGVVFVRGIIGSIPITVANIVTTSTDGLLLQNTTAATVGVPVQYSPRLRFCGTAWKTDATTASQTDCTFEELRPASAAGATTSTLVWGGSINGGAYADLMSLTSAGKLTLGASNNQLLTINALTGTSAVYQRFTNGSGDYFNGLESSAGGAVFVGSAAYAAVSGPSTATALQFATTNIVRVSIAAGGVMSTLVGLATGANLTFSPTAPSIGAGGCTGPAVTWNNGTAAMKVTLGTTCATVKTVTLTLPAATNQWHCRFDDQTAPQTYVLSANGTSTTAVVISNYARTTGLAADFADSEVIVGSCIGG